ncbi:MAG: glycerol-3-phosphate dehydrogenase C-terminal domain-containing protein, partial [Anaeromyxobacteraceae bacterium]
RHVLETDAERRHLTVFGGKLTDCLNVGEEICDEVRRLGVALPFPDVVWYGEPHPALREQYFHQARLMGLDAMTSPSASEKLSTRLWRRYGGGALPMLDTIRSDPRMAEVIIETSEYLRCELDEAARREMVVKLEDFLRRRSKIALVVRRDAIRDAAGLREAARILFGDAADAKIAEYFGERDARASLA